MFQLITIGAVLAVLGTLMVDYLAFRGRAAKWRGQIARSAKRHNVSRHVLGSILDKESNFREDVISGKTLGAAGEVGLGQFKPIAARDVGVDFSALFNNPDLQIDSTAKLLALNTKRLGGDVLGSVRAYNVGIGAAKKDASKGTVYMIDVMRIAALSWVYTGLLTSENN